MSFKNLTIVLPNEERTTMCNKSNWKVVLDIDYEEEQPKPIASEPPLHPWRSDNSNHYKGRSANEESNSANIRAMNEEHKELRYLMWNTFHIVEDI